MKTDETNINLSYIKERYSVSVSLTNARVQVIAPELTGVSYAYYLYTNKGKLVDHTGYVDQHSYIFFLKDSATYFVKVFFRIEDSKIIIESDLFDYISAEDKDRLDQHLATASEDVKLPNPFQLAKIREPYSYFLIGKGNVFHQEVSSFAQKHHLFVSNHRMRDCVLLTGRPFRGNTYLSGIMKYEKQLIVGTSEEIDEHILTDDNIGFFTYLKNKDDSIEIGTDYFGAGIVYYYQDQEDIICSNSYHLLLLFCSFLKKQLEINWDVFLAALCRSSERTDTRLSNRCEVKQIHVLPVDKRIEIDNNNLSLLNKTIVNDMHLSGEQINEKQYYSMLLSGCHEVKENMEVALQSNDFSRIYVDLTGGIDSRINYSALTNFKCNKDVGIFSSDWDPVDYKIALDINSYYHYPIFDPETMWEPVDTQELLDDFCGHMVLGGIYQSFFWILWTNTQRQADRLHILGGFGEVLRPYYTRNIIENDNNAINLSPDFVVATMSGSRKNILSARTYKALKTVLMDSLDDIPATTPIEKMELHFLYYHNRYHFGKFSGWRWNFSNSWSCLQSKSMFRLQRHTYFSKQDNRSIFELMALLNPFIAKIPYDKEINNNSKERHWDNMVTKELEQNVNSQLPDSITTIASDIKSSLTYDHNFEEPFQHSKELLSELDAWEARYQKVFKYLMSWKEGCLREMFGYQLFRFMEDEEMNKRTVRHTYYLKLLSLYCHIQIMENYK